MTAGRSTRNGRALTPTPLGRQALREPIWACTTLSIPRTKDATPTAAERTALWNPIRAATVGERAGSHPVSHGSAPRPAAPPRRTHPPQPTLRASDNWLRPEAISDPCPTHNKRWDPYPRPRGLVRTEGHHVSTPSQPLKVTTRGSARSHSGCVNALVGNRCQGSRRTRNPVGALPEGARRQLTRLEAVQ